MWVTLLTASTFKLWLFRYLKKNVLNIFEFHKVCDRAVLGLLPTACPPDQNCWCHLQKMTKRTNFLAKIDKADQFSCKNWQPEIRNKKWQHGHASAKIDKLDICASAEQGHAINTHHVFGNLVHCLHLSEVWIYYFICALQYLNLLFHPDNLPWDDDHIFILLT